MEAALLMCLSMVVYFEARGEPFSGQVAVAQVAMNRIDTDRDESEGSDPCQGYLKDKPRHKCTFSFYCDGVAEVIDDASAWRRSRVIATLVSNGALTRKRYLVATHYHRTDINPWWSGSLDKIGVIGYHVFYR